MTVFKVAVMICDLCQEEFNLGTRAFDSRDIRRAAKDRGWVTLRPKSGDRSWADVCPDCAAMMPEGFTS